MSFQRIVDVLVSLSLTVSVSGRQPSRHVLFDTSRRKIGRESVQNHIGNVFKRINSERLEPGKSKDATCVEMKKAFFSLLPQTNLIELLKFCDIYLRVDQRKINPLLDSYKPFITL